MEDWIQANLLDKDISAVSTHQLQHYLPEALGRHFDESSSKIGKPLSMVYQQNLRGYLANYVIPDRISTVQLGNLKRGDIEDFRGRLVTKLQDHRPTVNRVLKLLKLLLARAHRREDIDRDPAYGVDFIAEAAQVRRAFTDIELAKLFPDAVPWESGNFSPWSNLKSYTAGLLAATTGMRRGEIAALRWNSIILDRDPPHVVVREAVKDHTRTDVPKSGKPRPTPIFSTWLFGDDRAVQALSQLREQSINIGETLDHSRQPLLDGFVFQKKNGDRYRVQWFSNELLDAMTTAKIDRGSDNGTLDLSLHSFRHTIEGRLAAHGLSDSLIRAYIGHSDAKMQEHYTHHDLDTLKHTATQYGFASPPEGLDSKG